MCAVRTSPRPAQVGQGSHSTCIAKLARALARHFDQAERGEAVQGDARAVARERAAQLVEHGVPVLGAVHVDEVDDDDAAEVAQAQLPRDRLRRLEVGLEHRVVEVAAADEAAGVHVDRGHRLGLVDDQVAARLELDAARQRALDLGLDVVQVEQRPLAGVVLEARAHLRHVALGERGELLEVLARVDQHARGGGVTMSRSTRCASERSW